MDSFWFLSSLWCTCVSALFQQHLHLHSFHSVNSRIIGTLEQKSLTRAYFELGLLFLRGENSGLKMIRTLTSII